jgi:hypothetical protein
MKDDYPQRAFLVTPPLLSALQYSATAYLPSSSMLRVHGLLAKLTGVIKLPTPSSSTWWHLSSCDFMISSTFLSPNRSSTIRSPPDYPCLPNPPPQNLPNLPNPSPRPLGRAAIRRPSSPPACKMPRHETKTRMLLNPMTLLGKAQENVLIRMVLPLSHHSNIYGDVVNG